MSEAFETPPTSPLPWRRTWIVLLSSLVVPWVLRLFSSAQPQHGDMTCLFLMLGWIVVMLAWWGAAAGLAFRRGVLCGPLLTALILGWIGFVPALIPSDPTDREMTGEVFGGLFMCQLISFAVTAVLRFDCTLAHAAELPTMTEKRSSQFTLRTLLIVTAVLSVVGALLSAAVREKRLQELTIALPWLMLLNIAVTWNELLQPSLRSLNLALCSLTWLGFGIAGLFFNSTSHWLFTMLTATVLVFGVPLAYRWAGWRIVPRLMFLPAGTKL